MKWFLNVSTRTKLLLGFSLIILLLAVVVAVAYVAMDRSIEAQQELFNGKFRRVIDLLSVGANISDGRVEVLMMMNTTNQAELERRYQRARQDLQQNDDILKRLVETEWKGDPQFSQQLIDYRNVYGVYRDIRENTILPMLLQGKVAEARAMSVFGEQSTNYMRLRTASRELVRHANEDADTALKATKRGSEQALTIFIVIGAVAVLIAFFLAAYLNKIIAYPLQDVLAAAEQIANGDLRGEVPNDPRLDEVGALRRTFRRMVESLRDLNRQIQEGVNVLASSATQILTASSEMASSAAETATAVTQTTTTVEEVKQTAQISSQKARQVAEIAQRTATGSQEGRRSVEETVGSMGHMRTQMESVAESIVRLSEHSQAISEIIASVSELAERSNLLAVNAAIEAAKAGEQGKGFAVVAQEVRTLANQSKQATGQVRSILGNIQKATSSAVMAMEQGNRAVEASLQQSTRTGESIRELAESIDEAAQAARQISASAEQQSVGMDQVAQAMENIKQAANQNAQATRQTEGGARNLHELGQKLKMLVGRYKM